MQCPTSGYNLGPQGKRRRLRTWSNEAALKIDQNQNQSAFWLKIYLVISDSEKFDTNECNTILISINLQQIISIK